MKIWFFVLLTPLAWYISALVIYNLFGDENDNDTKIGAMIAGGFIGICTLWAFYFL